MFSFSHNRTLYLCTTGSAPRNVMVCKTFLIQVTQKLAKQKVCIGSHEWKIQCFDLEIKSSVIFETEAC